MAETRPIPVSDLLIDAENPRLQQPNVGQREAQRELARLQQRKLVVLAEDIVTNGLNLADLPIVMPFDARRSVVLEGNRRLVAIRALENPDLMVGALTPALVTKIKKLSADYQENPIESINCLVVKDRDEADHWRDLRHSGEMEGAGIVRWGADERARFLARGRVQEPHIQALDLLESKGVLTVEQRRKIPVASFKRLIGTPEVRAKAGMTVRDKKLVPLTNEKAMVKALQYIANDLASGNINTKDIYHKPDRVNYANNLPDNIVVKPTAKGGHGVGAQPQGKRTTAVKLPKLRNKLIPRDCILNVTDARIARIEQELRALNFEDYTNAVAVLFRVFVELSTDAYITRMALSKTVDDPLMKKLVAVATDLESRQKLTKLQARPVHAAAAKDSFLAPSVTQMNQWVHNPNGFPAPNDLRAYWDSLQPYFIAIWTP